MDRLRFSYILSFAYSQEMPPELQFLRLFFMQVYAS